MIKQKTQQPYTFLYFVLYVFTATNIHLCKSDLFVLTQSPYAHRGTICGFVDISWNTPVICVHYVYKAKMSNINRQATYTFKNVTYYEYMFHGIAISYKRQANNQNKQYTDMKPFDTRSA